MNISTADLYRLRHIQLAARRMALKAQYAEQSYRELLLELEHGYGLLGTDAVIDIHTGEIEMSPSNGNKPFWEGQGQTQEHDTHPYLEGRIQEFATSDAQ